MTPDTSSRTFPSYRLRGWSTKPFQLVVDIIGFGWGMWVIDPRRDSFTLLSTDGLVRVAERFSMQVGIAVEAEVVWGAPFVLTFAVGLCVLMSDFWFSTESRFPRSFRAMRIVSVTLSFCLYSSTAGSFWTVNPGTTAVVVYGTLAACSFVVCLTLVVPMLLRGHPSLRPSFP